MQVLLVFSCKVGLAQQDLVFVRYYDTPGANVHRNRYGDGKERPQKEVDKELAAAQQTCLPLEWAAAYGLDNEGELCRRMQDSLRHAASRMCLPGCLPARTCSRRLVVLSHTCARAGGTRCCLWERLTVSCPWRQGMQRCSAQVVGHWLATGCTPSCSRCRRGLTCCPSHKEALEPCALSSVVVCATSRVGSSWLLRVFGCPEAHPHPHLLSHPHTLSRLSWPRST